MKSWRTVACATVLFLCAPAWGGGSVERRTQVKLSGGAGTVFKLVGGKAAKEGLVTKTVIHGDRKKTVTNDRARIIDLAEELIYDLNLKKQTYRVTTFEEFRQNLEQALAADPGAMAGGEPAEDEDRDKVEYEVQIDVESTGNTETIHGLDCNEVQIVMTAYEKGKTLEEAGGAMITTLLMIGPKLAGGDEIAAFERKYAEKIGLLNSKTQTMARLLMSSPAIREAMAEFEAHREELDGTPVRQRMTVEMVPNPSAPASEESAESGATGFNKTMRGLGSKLGFKKKKSQPAQNQAADDAGAGKRKTVFTSTTEIVGSSANSSSADVEIPEGFKKKG